MPHDAPVNTVPTQAAGTLKPPPAVTVLFDVTDLGRTEAFYARLLGFRVAAVERAGLPYETRVMVSDRFPGVALFARRTFQRSVTGSTIGGVLQLGLREPELARRAVELEGQVTWVLPPVKGTPAKRVSFLDPDGYVIELFC